MEVVPGLYYAFGCIVFPDSQLKKGGGKEKETNKQKKST